MVLPLCGSVAIPGLNLNLKLEGGCITKRNITRNDDISIKPLHFITSFLGLRRLTPIPLALAQATVAEVTISHIEAQAEETGEVIVSAFVSVLDTEGQPISGLTAANFTLSDNNLPFDKQLLNVSPATDPLASPCLLIRVAAWPSRGPMGCRPLMRLRMSRSSY